MTNPSPAGDIPATRELCGRSTPARPRASVTKNQNSSGEPVASLRVSQTTRQGTPGRVIHDPASVVLPEPAGPLTRVSGVSLTPAANRSRRRSRTNGGSGSRGGAYIVVSIRKSAAAGRRPGKRKVCCGAWWWVAS